MGNVPMYLWKRDFIFKLAVGATTVLLAQASKKTPAAVSMHCNI